MHKPWYVYVYMTTNEKDGILYVGITNNILQKLVDHKFWLVEGLAKKYGLNRCVYYEFYADMDIAMARGKELKQWTELQAEKNLICNLIEEEMVSRSFYQEGRLKKRISHDPLITEPKRVLKDDAAYNKILTGK